MTAADRSKWKLQSSWTLSVVGAWSREFILGNPRLLRTVDEAEAVRQWINSPFSEAAAKCCPSWNISLLERQRATMLWVCIAFLIKFNRSSYKSAKIQKSCLQQLPRAPHFSQSIFFRLFSKVVVHSPLSALHSRNGVSMQMKNGFHGNGISMRNFVIIIAPITHLPKQMQPNGKYHVRTLHSAFVSQFNISISIIYYYYYLTSITESCIGETFIA